MILSAKSIVGQKTGQTVTRPFTKFNEISIEAKSQRNFFNKAAIVVISSKLSLWSIHFQDLVQKVMNNNPLLRVYVVYSLHTVE